MKYASSFAVLVLLGLASVNSYDLTAIVGKKKPLNRLDKFSQLPYCEDLNLDSDLECLEEQISVIKKHIRKLNRVKMNALKKNPAKLTKIISKIDEMINDNYDNLQEKSVERQMLIDQGSYLSNVNNEGDDDDEEVVTIDGSVTDITNPEKFINDIDVIIANATAALEEGDQNDREVANIAVEDFISGVKQVLEDFDTNKNLSPDSHAADMADQLEESADNLTQFSISTTEVSQELIELLLKVQYDLDEFTDAVNEIDTPSQNKQELFEDSNETNEVGEKDLQGLSDMVADQDEENKRPLEYQVQNVEINDLIDDVKVLIDTVNDTLNGANDDEQYDVVGDYSDDLGDTILLLDELNQDYGGELSTEVKDQINIISDILADMEASIISTFDDDNAFLMVEEIQELIENLLQAPSKEVIIDEDERELAQECIENAEETIALSKKTIEELEEDEEDEDEEDEELDEIFYEADAARENAEDTLYGEQGAEESVNELDEVEEFLDEMNDLEVELADEDFEDAINDNIEMVEDVMEEAEEAALILRTKLDEITQKREAY